MLLLDRADFAIEIPSFLVYQAKQMGRKNEIVSFAIQDYKKQL